jgi:ABC-type microcin C transport system permease subunit YejE
MYSVRIDSTDEYSLYDVIFVTQPWVLAIPIGAISGMFAFAMSVLCLRKRNLYIAVPIVYTCVLVTLWLVTILWGFDVWYISYGALTGSMLFCKYSEWTWLQLSRPKPNKRP